jgi:hypothetical protein
MDPDTAMARDERCSIDGVDKPSAMDEYIPTRSAEASSQYVIVV